MQEIPRAILLPPPSSAAQRSTRGSHALDLDLPVEAGTRRAASPAAGSFLTLIDSRREDTIELKGKQFRFRPYTNRGGAERAADSKTIERPSAEEAGRAKTGQAADEVLTGFAAGDGSRNSAAFLASFIAQEQLAEGLHNPPYADASDAYRRAGGSPPLVEGRPHVVRFAA